jgi:hypothetical protein
MTGVESMLRVSRLLFTALLAASTGLASACSSGAPGVAPEHPDLTGTWVINLEQSDEPGDRIEREPPPGAPGARRPDAGGERREGWQMGTALLLQNSVAFRLEEGDTTLKLTGAEGLTRVFYPDGRERDQRLEGLGMVSVKSRWRGDKLVVERTLQVGVKITEEFELSEEGRQLYVKMKISGGREALEFRRVYDPGEEGL